MTASHTRLIAAAPTMLAALRKVAQIERGMIGLPDNVNERAAHYARALADIAAHAQAAIIAAEGITAPPALDRERFDLQR